MSKVHEQSLLSESLSVEDLQDETKTDFTNKETSSKFGIENVHNDFFDKSLGKDWVAFDDDKLQQGANPYPFPTGLAKKPPDIPQRIALDLCNQSSMGTSSSKTFNQLGIQLNKPTLTSLGCVPPVPERLLSPKTSSVSSSPTHASSGSIDIRIPPPPSSTNGSLKRHSRSKSSLGGLFHSSVAKINFNSNTSAPPIPPRRDMLAKQFEKSSVSNISCISESSSQALFNLNDVGSSQDELLDFQSICTSTTTPSQYMQDVEELGSSMSSLNTSIVMIESTQTQNKNVDEDLVPWFSSTPPGSPKFNKKKKKGYQHLSSGSEEEEEPNSIIETDGGITIKVTDLSPVKPLSQWALMHNEGEERSSGSDNSAIAVQDDLELDVDDAFSFNADRLSTDGSVLKGFNRADKGSQNNLVDFSESADHLDRSSFNSSESSESELETVFDMTAQGDSMKRKRKKKINADPSSHSVLSSETSFVFDNRPIDEPQNCDEVKFDVKPSQNQPTNPFWRHSPLGDSVSLTSSESNPFDRIQFSTTFPSPLMRSPKQVESLIPILPPPPKPGKYRTLPGKSSRPRPQKNSLSYSIATSDSGNEIDESKRQTSESSSHIESRLGSARVTPAKSDALSLIDVTEQSGTSSDNAPISNNPSNHLRKTSSQSKVSMVEADTGSKDTTILESTLQILDGFSQSPDASLPSIDVKNVSVISSPALPTTEIGQSKSNSQEEVQTKVSADCIPRLNEDTVNDANKVKISNNDNPIQNKTEWKMLMKIPREKRLLSSRKWIDVYIRLNVDKIADPILQVYQSLASTTPFFSIPLCNNAIQLSKLKLQPRFVSTNEPKMERVFPGDSSELRKVRLSEEEFRNAFKRKVHSFKFYEVCYKEKRSFATKKDKYLTMVPSGFKHCQRRKELIKLGTENYADLIDILPAITNAAFKANSFRMEKDQETLTHNPVVKYHSRDEIMFEVQDQFTGKISTDGKIETPTVSVHVFVTSFLSGDPKANVTFNDRKVDGKEVAQRSDIIPSSNNFWIDMNEVEVHRCSPSGYESDKAAITFYPPDACRFELARFQCSYRDEAPPITVKPSVVINQSQITLRCNLRLSSNYSANDDPLYQIPCENLSIHFPIPDAWIPAFRRYEMGSFKSIRSERAAKRSPKKGKLVGGHEIVKGFASMEASIGKGKYEAAYGALVWRLKRFPEKNSAHNAPQVFSCSIQLQSKNYFPAENARDRYLYCQVEYTMPCTSASNCCIRSVNLPNTNRAEKFILYSAKYMYKVQTSIINETENRSPCLLQ